MAEPTLQPFHCRDYHRPRSPARLCRHLGLLLGIAGAFSGGCSNERSAAATTSDGGAATESSVGAIAIPAAPYRETNITSAGSIAGRVLLDGDPPRDRGPTAPPAGDQRVCGAAITDGSVAHSGNRLANVVVWINDVRVGKPLPIERRLEVTEAQCQFDPRIQAAVTGSTVDLHNEDATISHTRVLRAGTVDTITTIATNDAGQVVPSTRMAKDAGMVAIRVVEHPWMRAYIAVFDNPYFAVTDANGAFRLDSVPPGRYHLMAWHERGRKTLTQDAEVKAGAETKVEFRFNLK